MVALEVAEHANDGSTTCRGHRSSAPARWDSCSRSDGRRVSVRPWGRSSALAGEFGRDRTARFDPRVLLLLGLGIPFVVAALATEWVSTRVVVAAIATNARSVESVVVLLIVIGILEVTGAWHSFVLWLQVNFPSSPAIYVGMVAS
jgi:hypothetical protein